MMINMQQKVNEEKMIIIYKGIIYGIDIHRKAIEFSQFFIRDFQGSFFFLIVTGVISLSTCLVCIVSVDNIEEAFPFIIILFTLNTYLLMSNYVAQEVTDHNNHVFTTVYNVQWYVAPLRIQKMLLFLLQRGTKAFNLNLGGLFVGSLESAATIQYLLEQLQHIYNELTDENEIIIIEKYGYYAKCYTITFTLMLTSVAFALILYNHWPDACHILFYTNGTWSHRSLPYMTEYFMDKDKYFHVILFHANATFVVGGLSVVATGSILVVYAQHACGMFQIACYRIKRAMAFENLQKSNLENKNLICKGLICAVDMHRKAMTFADSIAIKFETVFSSFIIVGVVCASLNLYRMFQIILFGYNTVELFIRLSYGSVQLFYALIGNYLAQEIIDNNNNIFVTIYDVQWYVAPLQIQKMILFVLQRSAKLFTLKTGGIFVGSLEGAATLISTTVSYFTVLYSLRN
ncbi:PREDICTED: uncharacterized protein LOC105557882 [Vollenhovia emeryi]|uniref:uncharacterized protein LOC105557882 n=1 Tax=Vollenhovia emeryi TaxID=411798 RepID=UPI0005F51111|nr:PREDICTED: uncharacterized protein LOC105557882 [Vollenhovia emeryi]